LTNLFDEFLQAATAAVATCIFGREETHRTAKDDDNIVIGNEKKNEGSRWSM
jgi:hypothetical protein